MTVKQLKMWSRETVRRNWIEPAETENLSNSQKCLITLHIVGWVIIINDTWILSILLICGGHYINRDMQSRLTLILHCTLLYKCWNR